MFVNVDFFKISIPFRELDRSSILWIAYPEMDFPICSLITCYLKILFFVYCLLLISIISKRLFQFLAFEHQIKYTFCVLNFVFLNFCLYEKLPFVTIIVEVSRATIKTYLC